MHTHSHDHAHGDHTHDCPPGTPSKAASDSHAHSHFGHSHSHSHGHHGHEHPTLSPSILGWAMVATLGLVVAEVVGGIVGHSVALLNDAVHNLSDVPAIGLSFLAMRWAQRPADSEKTYGYHRAGTLAAFTNAVVLVLLSLWLGYESIERFRSPVEVVESWMIWTSLAALVLWSSIGILRESAHVLLEGRPPDCTVEDVARAVLTIDGVLEVHDIHIWSLGDDHNALSLHARIPDMHMDECERILNAIQAKCAADFNIGHATIQLERAGLPATSGYVMPAPAK